MQIIVSGYNQGANVEIEGMGKSQIIFDFDEDTLKSISFVNVHGYPRLRLATRNKFKHGNSQEIRHIKSKEWIKNDIKSTYEQQGINKLYINLNASNMGEKDTQKPDEIYCFISKMIAKKYLEAVRDESNVFLGSSSSNNFAGKLMIILKPFIEVGKKKFPKDQPLVVELPSNEELLGYTDFYGSIRNEFFPFNDPTDKLCLEIPSWDSLLEIYFAINFDHPSLSDSSKNRRYQDTKDTICNAQEDFLNIYEKFGSYDWQPSFFQSADLKEELTTDTSIFSLFAYSV